LSAIEDIAGKAAGLHSCWSCKGPVAGLALFCHTCGAVQPPGERDFFQRLGVEAAFDLDLDRLEKQYLGFQRALHPDRFATKPAKARAIAQSQAVALNEAFQTLKDPLRRASYLLRLKGHDSGGDADRTNADPGLLMEAMERREALAEAGDIDTVERQMADAGAAAIDVLAKLAQAFAGDDLTNAGRLVLRLTYLRKFLEEARIRRVALERD
jgi:molecular chaperone HscB